MKKGTVLVGLGVIGAVTGAVTAAMYVRARNSILVEEYNEYFDDIDDDEELNGSLYEEGKDYSQKTTVIEREMAMKEQFKDIFSKK